MRDSRGSPDDFSPEFDDEFDPRFQRRPREPGGAPDRRPPRGPDGPGPKPRPPRSRDSSDPGFERGPSRGPREPGMPPPRRSRPPDAERPGRGAGWPEEREYWPGQERVPDGEPRRRRRPPTHPGKPTARRKSQRVKRLHWRYRYGALVGIMLFAGVGGICLGLSGLGSHSISMGLILAAIPALLASIGCAATYVYF
ncbi:MAG TPA: hypothetical protein VH590_19455 [Ktedonobacterales bacterium]